MRPTFDMESHTATLFNRAHVFFFILNIAQFRSQDSIKMPESSLFRMVVRLFFRAVHVQIGNLLKPCPQYENMFFCIALLQTSFHRFENITLYGYVFPVQYCISSTAASFKPCVLL